MASGRLHPHSLMHKSNVGCGAWSQFLLKVESLHTRILRFTHTYSSRWCETGAHIVTVVDGVNRGMPPIDFPKFYSCVRLALLVLK